MSTPPPASLTECALRGNCQGSLRGCHQQPQQQQQQELQDAAPRKRLCARLRVETRLCGAALRDACLRKDTGCTGWKLWSTQASENLALALLAQAANFGNVQ